ncbi:MAG: hypothetical protein D3919_09515 [Candidatus Electrothrix sp. AW5]|nr:hypothetical protein [Candidatus Electrothrix sp. AX1]MCI5182818.1 hypothetical protein [Candidatus Electrothrix gigas]MCI5189526.1 hypothetical protein [Candidatus Electrothrix gigas]MCI5196453.1 hypothetical protein [Candidatus Electrothrix gigas]MCI5226364.1 hypothetical protein [Candidatus Electrothrix gigas]
MAGLKKPLLIKNTPLPLDFYRIVFIVFCNCFSLLELFENREIILDLIGKTQAGCLLLSYNLSGLSFPHFLIFLISLYNKLF